jgi:acetylornithine aminotransferase
VTTSDQPTRATLPYAAQGRPESGEQWTERYRGAVMNTFGDPQRVLVRGEGSTVWDVDGNHYLDLLAGIAVNALGHAHPAVVQAVTEQLGTLGHVSNFFTTEPQVRLAERLAALLDPGSDEGADVPVRTFFANSGTEANEAAFKATRRTGRTTVVVAEGSFHGRSMGALALTSKAAYREPFEPIQGEAGVVVPPEGYLARARAITREHGALLWIDEVQTGVGRTGAWFAFQESGVVPDLVTLAKGLGGGFPVGACIGIGDAATLLGPGNHGTTFGGNPVACAAALAVLDTIESDGLLAQATTRGDQLASALAAHPRVAEVTGRGLMLGVVLTDPRAADVQKAALDAGLVLNAPTPDRLRIVPPLVLTEAEAAHATTTLSAVISEVLA